MSGSASTAPCAEPLPLVSAARAQMVSDQQGITSFADVALQQGCVLSAGVQSPCQVQAAMAATAGLMPCFVTAGPTRTLTQPRSCVWSISRWVCCHRNGRAGASLRVLHNFGLVFFLWQGCRGRTGTTLTCHGSLGKRPAALHGPFWNRTGLIMRLNLTLASLAGAFQP